MADGVGPPHLADATDLERWADQRSAQADLPRLVRRLVRHENDQVQRVEMRGGDGVGLPGYDGLVEAARGTSFVPGGLSVWEMGTGKNPAEKATADYKSRTADPLGVDMARATFVFVTPRRWGKKQDWEQRRRNEGKWRDVRVLDADDIEQALEESPAVRIWVSELLDMPALGVATIEEWWRRFSSGFDPTLTPDVVLAGREDHAAALLRRLSVDVGRTFVKAASVDDGLAFAACTMAAQRAEDSEPMLSRSLLVHDGVTLRRLDSTTSLLILLPYEEQLQREAQLVENHHVVSIVSAGHADIELPPLDHLVLEAALRGVGVPEKDLTRYVRAGNKSLLALQRVATRFGRAEPDQWFQDLSDRLVRRAWLAGAWSHLRSGDLEVLEELTAATQDELEERLERVRSQPDPLFTRVGGTWAVAAVEDSWRAARHAVRGADLRGLERAAQDVLGSVDPRLDLPADERWSAAIHGKARIHSSDLRKGIGRSIALLGARGDEVRLSGGRSARQWAEGVVHALLDRANDDDSGQLWASLEDVLPLLAEAAPDVFLRAVVEASGGPHPLIRELFQDRDVNWQASSPHTGLLWALECVAWSDRHVGFAAEVLARLAEVDPGGRLSNRPAASLRDVFRPWLPQTAAPAETRLMILDALLERHKEVAWDLLMALLPEQSVVGMYSYKPQFRSWAPEGDRSVTRDEYFTVVDSVAERIVRVAADEPQRWRDVIPEFDRLPDVARREAIERLEALDPEHLGDEAQIAIWDAAQGFVRKHRQYPDADWSLSEEWLVPLARVGDNLTPPSPTERNRWLFESWHPDVGVALGDDLTGYDAEVKLSRQNAISEIFDGEGLTAVSELATTVELPWAVGSALAAIDDVRDHEVLSLLDSEDTAVVQFADGFVRSRSEGVTEVIRSWLKNFDGRPRVQARLLLTLGNVNEAWDLLSELSTEADEIYWSEFIPYGRGADFPHAPRVAEELLRHGRAAMAVDTLSLYAGRLEAGAAVDVVLNALTKFGTLEDHETGRVSSHDIVRLLDYLRSSGVDETEVALLEWKFLPLLRYEGKSPSLQRLLARDPATFVELVGLAFKPASSSDGGGERDVDENLASNAYRLLREWRVVPGLREDGTVDGAALQEWLATTRALLENSDRLEIGELQIGEVLAHAPRDPDGTFPAQPVRDVLEAAPNDRLERGFVVGVLNKRGVTSRGMTEGGQQEYDLAEKYESWAASVDSTHPRTAGALRSVADSYRTEGRRNDDEARRFLEGLDR